MKIGVKLSLLTVVLALVGADFAPQAFACGAHPEDGFLPPNKQYIPVRTKKKIRNGREVILGINEKEFNDVMDSVEKVYTPIVAEKGGKLFIERNWTDGTVNAYASRQGKTWKVAMFGGLARHPETTPDGFMLVVCHELGHHLGVNPRYNRGAGEWASTEGQSDYFATLKCARRVLEKQDNVGIVAKMEIPGIVREKCEASFRSANEAAICIRSSMGGLSLARLLNSISGPVPEDKMPFFTKVDKTVVKTTYEAHPQAQCRLDTYYNGSTCDKPVTEELDEKDIRIGACTMEGGDKEGYRPRCWYAPESKATNEARNRAARARPSHVPSNIRYF